jgi:hypothetical protein
MGPEGILPCSKESATDPYLKPDDSSPLCLALVLKIIFNIILRTTHVSSKPSLPLNIMCISHRPHACRMSCLSHHLFYHSNGIYLVRSDTHVAPHYAISMLLFLFLKHTKQNVLKNPVCSFLVLNDLETTGKP